MQTEHQSQVSRDTQNQTTFNVKTSSQCIAFQIFTLQSIQSITS